MSKESVKNFFKDVFSINENKATKAEIKEYIISGSKLKGTNMCILILAIIIACVGLNMNSVEMIIGAMLISPMMGAIIGMGYNLATGDMKYFKRALVALCIQMAISLTTSTIYFLITPISTPSSALLLRTAPTIWDVIIAITGGLAGGIGVTRKEKGNILPGVAIATGLVPPLCTAGYGISMLNMNYFLGAIYMFFINAFFICVSSMIVFRIMKMPKKKGETAKETRKIQRDLIIIAIITIIPSIILAYPVVVKSVIEGNVQKYLNNEFTYPETQIVKSNIDTQSKEIKLVLIGKVLDEEEIMNLTNKLSEYNLQDMNLKITQTEVEEGITKEEIEEYKKEKNTEEFSTLTEAKQNTDISEIKQTTNLDKNKILEELKNKHSTVQDVSITNNKTITTTDNDNQTIIVTVTLNGSLSQDEEEELNKDIKELVGDNILINKTIVNANK